MCVCVCDVTFKHREVFPSTEEMQTINENPVIMMGFIFPLGVKLGSMADRIPDVETNDDQWDQRQILTDIIILYL